MWFCLKQKWKLGISWKGEHEGFLYIACVHCCVLYIELCRKQWFSTTGVVPPVDIWSCSETSLVVATEYEHMLWQLSK